MTTRLLPATLAGRHVRLEPLTRDHLPHLVRIGLDPDLWRWTTSVVRTPEEMRLYVRAALDDQRRGTALPFATVETATGSVVGSTRLTAFSPEHRRVEIGYTWIASPWQRTVVNTEAKLLLFTHAFETLGMIRVELKTDALNERSRRAILRLGATEEGVLRRHMITATGRTRDTVYYSVIDGEWPAVRERLRRRLEAGPDHGSGS